MKREDNIYKMFKRGISIQGIAECFSMSEISVREMLFKEKPREYRIDICDPATKLTIIPSIDRDMAMSAEEAVMAFKKRANWKSNWLVMAIPTKYKEDQPKKRLSR